MNIGKLKDSINSEKHFSSGVSHLTYLKAWEYREIMLILPHVFIELNISKEIRQPIIEIGNILMALREKEFDVSLSVVSSLFDSNFVST